MWVGRMLWSIVILLALLPVLVGPASLTTTTDIILISAPVAAHAVGDVGDAFFLMLAEDIPGGVLMASVASVCVVLFVLMARRARRIVITVQEEVPRVIEG